MQAELYKRLGDTRDTEGPFVASGRPVEAPAVPSTSGLCVVVRIYRSQAGHGPGVRVVVSAASRIIK